MNRGKLLKITVNLIIFIFLNKLTIQNRIVLREDTILRSLDLSDTETEPEACLYQIYDSENSQEQIKSKAKN